MAKVSTRFMQGQTWAQEAPSGLINGVNVIYALTHTPDQALSLHVFVDGLLQSQVAPSGVSVTGNLFTLPFAPVSGQTVIAVYQY